MATLLLSSSCRSLRPYKSVRNCLTSGWKARRLLHHVTSSSGFLARARNGWRRLITSDAATEGRGHRVVAYWLLGCCGMTAGAVVLGGVTRLTESGLSMTNWHIVKGMKPPQSQAEWEAEFERYKQFPEYKYVHRDMTLQDFKMIFYMEYAHRMWGRAVGVVFAVPAVFFLYKKWVPKSLKPRLGIYGGLILCQGLLGWWMVKSGLEEKPTPDNVPRVSQYRLAGHLGMAFMLHALMLYSALGILLPPQQQPATARVARLKHFAHGAVGTVFLTALSGAFVAGLDAGLVYNSFPKMGGQWIPDDLMALSPKIKNMFENTTTVQFNHRILGTTTLMFILGTFALARGAGLSSRARLATNCMAGMAFVQVGLGISTLLFYVPTPLAASHQAGSLTLLSLAIWLMHELRKTKIPKI